MIKEESIKKKFKKAVDEAKEYGLDNFKNGNWLLILIKKSFSNYWERANSEYFEEKYKTKDKSFLTKKLTKVASNNAAMLGAIVGSTISADEVIIAVQAILTPATAGASNIPLPAEIALATFAILGEAIVLIKLQLQLVANIAKIYNVPLDPEDPEDIIIILKVAIVGAVTERTGWFGMKIGGKYAKTIVKKVVKKETLEALKKIGAKFGIKILQRSIIKYAVPIVSIGIGSTWNYFSTKTVGKVAQKYFSSIENEK